MRYKLSLEQIQRLLELGIRVVDPKEKLKGDMIAGFLLVPTFKGEWIRNYARSINSSWEGSYIPLILYHNKTGVILVDYKEVDQWYNLAARLTEALGIPITPRGD